MKHTIDRKTNLFIVLGGLFLTNALLAELVGIKIFSLESTMGFAPAQIHLLTGWTLDFNLTAGVILWPVVFVTTDIINEYFGKEGVKKISYLTVIFILYTFIIIALVSWLEPAGFWLDINSKDEAGDPFNINYAFDRIFLQGPRIIAGSLIAFLIGQLLDVFVFHQLRSITGKRRLWLRATGSTLVSQLIDSFVVLFIAFFLLAPDNARWSIMQVISVGIINYIYKAGIAVLMTPLLYVAHYLIDNYLGKEQSEKMMQEAAAESESLL